MLSRVVLFSFIMVSCATNVTPIETLTLTSTLSPAEGGALIFASVDKASSAAFQCSLRVVDGANKEFSFSIDAKQDYRVLKLAPGKYAVNKLSCGVENSIEITPLSFEVVGGKITIGPAVKLNVKNRSVNYLYGSADPDLLIKSLQEIGDNSFDFFVPKEHLQNVKVAVSKMIQPVRMSVTGPQTDINKIDLNQKTDLEECNISYLLNQPVTGKQFSFNVEFVKGKMSPLVNFAPDVKTANELKRRECVTKKMTSWQANGLTFKLHVR